ncbi:CIC11C00000005879 [Sungouiella intermedia]|uniref:CIC11C00000005879 n=1 Tax=Sungouiella intermedia TaxID=45354 RepID=A0A1L0BBN5_9ASCO|nr:CIC11C00000005879 [[Candida] intermedia]
MEKYLLSICLGGNSTLFAMKEYPEYFDDIKAIVLLQPISMKCFVDQFIKRENLDYDAVLEYMEKKILEGSSFKLDDFSVVEVASGCKIPTKVLQVKKDILTDIQNVQDVFDNLATDKKELFWIEDTEIRFQGYNYLGKEPKQMLDWFAKF